MVPSILYELTLVRTPKKSANEGIAAIAEQSSQWQRWDIFALTKRLSGRSKCATSGRDRLTPGIPEAGGKADTPALIGMAAMCQDQTL